MNQRDREAIEGLFDRIARVAQRSGPRDRGAEALIQCEISQQPAAPYYMAQTILMQEKALEEAQARIDELEGRGNGRAGRDGLATGPWGNASGWGAGGGFLAGAAQTAMGVAGGVLLGNMLADWLTPDAAEAQAAGESFLQDSEMGVGPESDAANLDVADAGGGFGDFDFGDF
jgi:hypothetical protein